MTWQRLLLEESAWIWNFWKCSPYADWSAETAGNRAVKGTDWERRNYIRIRFLLTDASTITLQKNLIRNLLAI
jgi:hypothetical protein